MVFGTVLAGPGGVVGAFRFAVVPPEQPEKVTTRSPMRIRRIVAV
jgi:hypothetical protein